MAHMKQIWGGFISDAFEMMSFEMMSFEMMCYKHVVYINQDTSKGDEMGMCYAESWSKIYNGSRFGSP